MTGTLPSPQAQRDHPTGPDEVRRLAADLVAIGEPPGLAEAALLLASLGDLPDPDGLTRHLTGLVQFLRLHYEAAAATLTDAVAADPTHPEWVELLRRAQQNTTIRLAESPIPTTPFDPDRLTAPPAGFLREPQDIQPLPRRNLAMRLRELARDVLGAIATPFLSLLLWWETRHGIPQAWVEWPALKPGDLRKDLKIGGIRNWMNANTLQSTEAPGTLVDSQAEGQAKPWFADRFPTADGSWTTDDPREGAAGSRVSWQGQTPMNEVRRDRSEDPDLPSVREAAAP